MKPTVGSADPRAFGRDAEAVAAAYLVSLGYRLEAANYRCRHGEVDLVAWDGSTLVFVEVKARRVRTAGGPGEAIDRRKLNRMRTVADHFLAHRFGGMDLACRFDAVLIEEAPAGSPSSRTVVVVRGVL